MEVSLRMFAIIILLYNILPNLNFSLLWGNFKDIIGEALENIEGFEFQAIGKYPKENEKAGMYI